MSAAWRRDPARGLRETVQQGGQFARRRRKSLLLGLAALVFVIGVTVLVSWQALMPGSGMPLAIGSVVTADVRAPYSLTWVSDILTDSAREQARASVGPIFDPPDPNVSRQQSALLGSILLFIEDVRQDIHATPEQKSGDLAQITALTLNDEVRLTIVTADDPTWQLMALETQSVLERVMREPIREQDMAQTLATLPTQVSVRFTPAESAAISAIVGDLVRPNSLINQPATDAARELAVANVEPVNRSFERGQVIIRAGEQVDALDREALAQFGLLDTPDMQMQIVLRGVASSLLLLYVTSLYLRRVQPGLTGDVQRLFLLETILLLTLLGVRLISLAGQIVFIPAALVGIVFVSLTTPGTALFAAFLTGVVSALMIENSLEVALYAMMAGMIGALLVRSTDRITHYFYAGLVMGLANAVVLLIFRSSLLLAGQAGELGLWLLAALAMGLVLAIAALAIVYLLTLLLNLPTSLKLIELSQPNHPLLQRLLREAPGTYQHSLQVANLSEQAANAVGADSELVRVSALYHDVGKMMNPVFFIENQADHVNPHDALNDPYRSASIIISHVPDGDRLARQHRLPARVRDFIWQHHGTTRTGYFYSRAIDQAGSAEGVDAAAFDYPGPRPQTREAAIVMLADSSESTVRARKPASRQEIAEIVQQIIDARMDENQLDESDLTLKDLRTIHRIFVEVLQGVFHPRINYPAANTRRTAEAPALTSPAPAPPVPAAPLLMAVEEDSPLADVPPLRRSRAADTVQGTEPPVAEVRGADE